MNVDLGLKGVSAYVLICVNHGDCKDKNIPILLSHHFVISTSNCKYYYEIVKHALVVKVRHSAFQLTQKV